MCRQEVALSMLKAQKNRGGLTLGQIKLAEAQIEDHKKEKERQKQDMINMDTRMTNIEQKVDDMGLKVDELVTSMSEVKSIVQKKTTLSGTAMDLLTNKIIMTIMLLAFFIALSFAVGIPLSDLIESYLRIKGAV